MGYRWTDSPRQRNEPEEEELVFSWEVQDDEKKRRGTWPRPDVETWRDVEREVLQHGTETSKILS